jgi:hypothetical protein
MWLHTPALHKRLRAWSASPLAVYRCATLTSKKITQFPRPFSHNEKSLCAPHGSMG